MSKKMYARNLLVESTIQIRFPTILSISAKEPVEFQEAVRSEYPIYHSKINNERTIMLNVTAPDVEPPIIQTQASKRYIFTTDDGNYKITLTNSFISISTINYKNWESFIGKFTKPLESFIKIYKPAFFERIGIRYIDAVSKERLNVQEKKWCELIDEKWIGVLSTIDEKDIINNNTAAEYYLHDKSVLVRVHLGLGRINNRPEKNYIIDCDTIKIKKILCSDDYLCVLDELHKYAETLFESVITDATRKAMNSIK